MNNWMTRHLPSMCVCVCTYIYTYNITEIKRRGSFCLKGSERKKSFLEEVTFGMGLEK